MDISQKVKDQALMKLDAVIDDTPPWRWCEENVDFSRVPLYDTQRSGPYSASYLPFWKEPCEMAVDPKVREVIILKNSRAGCSENVLLSVLRYTVAKRQQHTLYITQDQVSSERFFEKRIKLGLKASPVTASMLSDARQTETEIDFTSMSLVCTYCKHKSVFRQDGYQLILCDELSSYQNFAVDLLRRRQANYPYSHIVMISSPDATAKRPQSEDPIFQEIATTDEREYMMPDPVTGNLFSFKFGGLEDGFGLKWDGTAKDKQSGRWDLDAVKESAYYLTPDGSRIYEDDRKDLIQKGEWVATKSGISGRVGYKINALYMPWESLGGIAVAFLEAKRKGRQALKCFVNEYLAEPFADDVEKTEIDKVEKQKLAYGVGDNPVSIYCPGKSAYVFVTADVQKNNVWACTRVWVDGGDSYLIDYQSLPSLENLEIYRKKMFAQRVLVDAGYHTLEVMDYCRRTGAIPVVGSDGVAVPYKKKVIDPYEGAKGSDRYKIGQIVFNPHIFKSLLSDLMQGENPEHRWHLPKDISHDYLMQVTGEELRDGKWTKIRPNHAMDCEDMQLLCAVFYKIYKFDWM